MLTGTQQIPFSNDDVYSGLAKLDGILTVSKDHLALEFQTQDAVFGVMKSKPRVLKIPLLELSAFKYKRNLFTSRIIFRVTKLNLIRDFPKSEQGEVKLKIKRKYKEEARRIESFVNYRVSELRLEEMDEDGEFDPM